MREKRAGFIFWVVVFCSLRFCSSDNDDEKSRQTFVIRYKDGEQTIPVTVVLDYKKQTEYVINMNPRTPAKSVTLYDFKQRTIAYKDLTNRECFLGRLTHETLSEEVHALQDVKNPVEGKPKFRSLDPRRPALTPTEIRNIAGQKTAVFCRKMNTWLLMPDRPHGISKREAEDEFEERTLHYQGHRSTQYSHYQRETRRRFRNRGQATNGRRAQRNKSATDKENRWLPVSEPNPHQPRGHFVGNNYFNPGYPEAVLPDNNHSSSLPEHQIPYNSLKNFEDDKRNGNNRISFENSVPLSRPHKNGDDIPYPVYDSKLLSSGGNSGSSNYFNPNSSDDIPDLNRVKEHYVERNNPVEYALTEGLLITTEISNASDISSYPGSHTVNYPNVHPSLAHLLPVYKPLSQEFDFRSNSLNNKTHPRPNIESELHSSEPDHSGQDFKFLHLTNDYNTSHDPDASVNVLEVPRVTKVINVSHDPVVALKEVPNTIENHPSVPRTYFRNPSYSRERNPFSVSDANLENSVGSLEKLYLEERKFHNPQPHASTTASLPVLTTPGYLVTDRTTSPVYVPSVHTAFQNSEDFNTFQIFPSYAQNNNTPSFEKNLTVSSSQESNMNLTDSRSETVTYSGFPATQYPLTEGKHGESLNHRSDIPSEDSKRKSPSSHNLTYPSLVNHTNQHENVPPYRTRYQSALRHFKPDEIIIDVENIPTHTLPPVTSSFQQRIPTTVRPTFRAFRPSEVQRKDEQILGSSYRNFYPVTRYPRRRVGDKIRRPIQQNGPFVHPQRGSLYQNNYPDLRPHPQVNQLIGVNPYNPSDRRQTHYPSRPHPVRLPTELNHLHHFGQLNSLPPGVSMHPRHPQAPFADMIRSNRPPTLPLGVDHPPAPKQHRQRHHRKKDRHTNSCCRLRGKSGAFQSCCRNGGPCCSLSQRRGSSCCSSSEAIEQSVAVHQIQPPFRTVNPIQPPVRTAKQIAPPIRDEEMQRSDTGVKDRCQKEKMCITVYESTQQVMVCRNAHVEGC